MGAYTTQQITDSQYSSIVTAVRKGYAGHRPNPQIAMILELEANLGCRIGDIVALKKSSIVTEGSLHRLNITEQKTGKKRYFVIPEALYAHIMRYCEEHDVQTDRIFTITSAAVWKTLRQVTKYLGIHDVSSHSFRKRAATKLYEATGHDIQLVSQFLQHSSTEMTMRYIKRTDSQLEKALSGMIDLV